MPAAIGVDPPLIVFTVPGLDPGIGPAIRASQNPTKMAADRAATGARSPDAGSLEVTWPGAAPVEAPAAYVDQRIEDHVSEDGTNSQGVAFETWLSAQP
jgi:hypothetical protein